MDSFSPRARTGAAPRALLLTTVLLFVLRLAWIIAKPDFDSDAYGHFGIGCALAKDPRNLSAHWVWLPLYHYLLASFAALRIPFVAVRFLQSLCAFALPWTLFRFAEQNGHDSTLAEDAGIACAVASSTNLLGVSAQQEAMFALVVLLSASAVDQRRPWTAGFFLAAASLIRYEAWGATTFLMGFSLLGVLLQMPRFGKLTKGPGALSQITVLARSFPIGIWVPAVFAIAGWLVVLRLYSGVWLGSLKELYEFTHMQRGVYSRGLWTDASWFPIRVPLWIFGPAVLIVPIGLRRLLSPGLMVPLAIYAFLLASYAGGGSLGSARYYASLVPFFCLAMVTGAWKLSERLSARTHRIPVYLVWASLGGFLVLGFGGLTSTGQAEASALRSAEHRLDGCREKSPRE